MNFEGSEDEVLPENLAKIKSVLLKGEIGGHYGEPENQGEYKIKCIYDTGEQPETGISRDDDAVVKVTESDATVQYAKVNYYHRSGKIHGITFMTEDEANAFIEKQKEYYKKYWDEGDEVLKKQKDQ